MLREALYLIANWAEPDYEENKAGNIIKEVLENKKYSLGPENS